jgi:hypothetical protein
MLTTNPHLWMMGNICIVVAILLYDMIWDHSAPRGRAAKRRSSIKMKKMIQEADDETSSNDGLIDSFNINCLLPFIESLDVS